MKESESIMANINNENNENSQTNETRKKIPWLAYDLQSVIGYEGSRESLMKRRDEGSLKGWRLAWLIETAANLR